MLKAFDLQVGHYYGGLGSLARRGEERSSTASGGLSIDESDAVAAVGVPRWRRALRAMMPLWLRELLRAHLRSLRWLAVTPPTYVF